MMQFELWDIDGANLVGYFDSEAGSLAIVREMIENYGTNSVGSFALSAIDIDGKRSVVANGNDLVDLVNGDDNFASRTPLPSRTAIGT